MTSSCLSQFRGWKIPILIGDWRCHSGISRSFNGFIIYRFSYISSWTLQDSTHSPSHLTFFHHISTRWSEVHMVSHLSFWGSSSCSIILYYDVNNILSLLINLSGLNAKKFYVLLISNKETVPFHHLLVVNSYNIDIFEWMRKILMIYKLMEFN